MDMWDGVPVRYGMVVEGPASAIIRGLFGTMWRGEDQGLNGCSRAGVCAGTGVWQP